MKEGGYLWMVCSAWIQRRLFRPNPEAVTKEAKRTGKRKAYSGHPGTEGEPERQ
jgi:hypothetical protein